MSLIYTEHFVDPITAGGGREFVKITSTMYKKYYTNQEIS